MSVALRRGGAVGLVGLVAVLWWMTRTDPASGPVEAPGDPEVVVATRPLRTAAPVEASSDPGPAPASPREEALLALAELTDTTVVRCAVPDDLGDVLLNGQLLEVDDGVATARVIGEPRPIALMPASGPDRPDVADFGAEYIDETRFRGDSVDWEAYEAAKEAHHRGWYWPKAYLTWTEAAPGAVATCAIAPPPDDTVEVTVRLVDPDGKPIEGGSANGQLLVAGPDERSDADGLVRVEAHPDVPTWIAASADRSDGSWAGVTSGVVPGAGVVEIVLEPREENPSFGPIPLDDYTAQYDELLTLELSDAARDHVEEWRAEAESRWRDREAARAHAAELRAAGELD